MVTIPPRAPAFVAPSEWVSAGEKVIAVEKKKALTKRLEHLDVAESELWLFAIADAGQIFDEQGTIIAPPSLAAAHKRYENSGDVEAMGVLRAALSLRATRLDETSPKEAVWCRDFARTVEKQQQAKYLRWCISPSHEASRLEQKYPVPRAQSVQTKINALREQAGRRLDDAKPKARGAATQAKAVVVAAAGLGKLTALRYDAAQPIAGYDASVSAIAIGHGLYVESDGSRVQPTLTEVPELAQADALFVEAEGYDQKLRTDNPEHQRQKIAVKRAMAQLAPNPSLKKELYVAIGELIPNTKDSERVALHGEHIALGLMLDASAADDLTPIVAAGIAIAQKESELDELSIQLALSAETSPLIPQMTSPASLELKEQTLESEIAALVTTRMSLLDTPAQADSALAAAALELAKKTKPSQAKDKRELDMLIFEGSVNELGRHVYERSNAAQALSASKALSDDALRARALRKLLSEDAKAKAISLNAEPILAQPQSVRQVQLLDKAALALAGITPQESSVFFKRAQAVVLTGAEQAAAVADKNQTAAIALTILGSREPYDEAVYAAGAQKRSSAALELALMKGLGIVPRGDLAAFAGMLEKKRDADYDAVTALAKEQLQPQLTQRVNQAVSVYTNAGFAFWKALGADKSTRGDVIKIIDNGFAAELSQLSKDHEHMAEAFAFLKSHPLDAKLIDLLRDPAADGPDSARWQNSLRAYAGDAVTSAARDNAYFRAYRLGPSLDAQSVMDAPAIPLGSYAAQANKLRDLYARYDASVAALESDHTLQAQNVVSNIAAQAAISVMTLGAGQAVGAWRGLSYAAGGLKASARARGAGALFATLAGEAALGYGIGQGVHAAALSYGFKEGSNAMAAIDAFGITVNISAAADAVLLKSAKSAGLLFAQNMAMSALLQAPEHVAVYFGASPAEAELIGALCAIFGPAALGTANARAAYRNSRFQAELATSRLVLDPVTKAQVESVLVVQRLADHFNNTAPSDRQSFNVSSLALRNKLEGLGLAAPTIRAVIEQQGLLLAASIAKGPSVDAVVAALRDLGLDADTSRRVATEPAIAAARQCAAVPATVTSRELQIAATLDALLSRVYDEGNKAAFFAAAQSELSALRGPRAEDAQARLSAVVDKLNTAPPTTGAKAAFARVMQYAGDSRTRLTISNDLWRALRNGVPDGCLQLVADLWTKDPTRARAVLRDLSYGAAVEFADAYFIDPVLGRELLETGSIGNADDAKLLSAYEGSDQRALIDIAFGALPSAERRVALRQLLIDGELHAPYAAMLANAERATPVPVKSLVDALALAPGSQARPAAEACAASVMRRQALAAIARVDDHALRERLVVKLSSAKQMSECKLIESLVSMGDYTASLGLAVMDNFAGYLPAANARYQLIVSFLLEHPYGYIPDLPPHPFVGVDALYFSYLYETKRANALAILDLENPQLASDALKSIVRVGDTSEMVRDSRVIALELGRNNSALRTFLRAENDPTRLGFLICAYRISDEVGAGVLSLLQKDPGLNPALLNTSQLDAKLRATPTVKATLRAFLLARAELTPKESSTLLIAMARMDPSEEALTRTAIGRIKDPRMQRALFKVLASMLPMDNLQMFGDDARYLADKVTGGATVEDAQAMLSTAKERAAKDPVWGARHYAPIGRIRGEAELPMRLVVDVLNEQLGRVTPEQVEAMVRGKDSALAREVLAKASGFANIDALSAFAQWCRDQGSRIYAPTRHTLADNLIYLGIKTENQLPTLREIENSTASNRCLVVLDDIVLTRIENDPEFRQRLIDNNCQLINPRGFDTGINLFTPRSLIARKLAALVETTRQLGGDPNKALDAPIIARLTQADPRLLAQMRSYEPSTLSIMDNLNGSAGLWTHTDAQEIFQNIPAQYHAHLRELLARDAEIYTPQRIGAALLHQQQQIMRVAAQAGIPWQNVFFFVPAQYKSYGLLALAHQSITRTSTSQYIHSVEDLADRSLDPSSTLVVIFDDVAGSGDSLSTHAERIRSYYQGGLVVAPSITTAEAITRLEGTSGSFNQRDLNGIIYAPSQKKLSLFDSPHGQTMSFADASALRAALGGLGYGNNGLSIVFPYMAPDNNNQFFGTRVAKHYLVDKNHQASKNTKYVAPSQ